MKMMIPFLMKVGAIRKQIEKDHQLELLEVFGLTKKKTQRNTTVNYALHIMKK